MPALTSGTLLAVQFVCEPVQADGRGVELGCQRFGPLAAAVGNGHGFHALAREMPGAVLDHLAGADHQHRQPIDLTEDLVRQLERGERQRHRVVADAGLGAHDLRGLERMLEKAVQNGAEGLVLLGGLPGLLDLADHLGFAEHHRIHARGDLEQMQHGQAMLQREQVFTEAARLGLMPLMHPFDQCRYA